MKVQKIHLAVLLVLQMAIPPGLFAQEVKEVEKNWFAFSQKLNATPYRGMNFILESRIKTEVTPDSTGSCGMWARVDTKKGMGFFDNMSKRLVTVNQWKKYSITGTIDTNAVNLFFGGIVLMNGSFYYDDFTLKVETNNGWKNIPLNSGDIEGDNATAWNYGVSTAPIKVKGYSMFFEKEKTSKNTFLKVIGSGLRPFGYDNARGKYFSTNGVKLYYETYGNGEPLLLLHGNGQSISAFTRQILFFEQQYQVIVPDCRGRGKSTDSDAELTYDIQASDMNNLLDHLDIDSANIIGWSDGGIIGLIMAKDYPNKVKRLIASGANVLQDTTAFFPGDSLKFRKISLDTSQSEITRKRYKLMLDYPNISFSALGKIKCPVLIVAGDKDEIRIGHTVKMFESIPGAQLFIVPKTSHYVLSENYEVFNAAALKFLQEKQAAKK